MLQIAASDTAKPKISATNTALKAIAVKEGMTDSAVLAAAYTVASSIIRHV